jgi:hypothetical protein
MFQCSWLPLALEIAASRSCGVAAVQARRGIAKVDGAPAGEGCGFAQEAQLAAAVGDAAGGHGGLEVGPGDRGPCYVGVEAHNRTDAALLDVEMAEERLLELQRRMATITAAVPRTAMRHSRRSTPGPGSLFDVG